MLKALVISPNERTVDFGCLLAIARAEACRREQVRLNPAVRALVFVAKLGVYVAVYEVLVDEKVANNDSALDKISNQKLDNRKSKQEVS